MDRELSGVGLLKIADRPHTFVGVEEFYVVAFRGYIVPARFVSYADATAHYEKLLGIGYARPGMHARTIFALPEAQVAADVA